MKKVLKAILNLIINILVIIALIILLISIYYLFQTKILKKDYVNICGYTIFEVATGSMSGTIEVGDVIIVKLTKDVNLEDIVVYKQDSNLITHRIISIDGEKVITKGDANNTGDAPITINDIIGKVIYTVRNVGIWKKVLLTPQVLISLTITIVLTGITITYSPKDNKKEKKIEEKSNK